MQWSISYDESDALIQVKVEGRLLARSTAEMALQGVDLARQKDCNKFLIDYSLAEVADSAADTYAFMKDLPALGITRTDRIAIVYARDRDKHAFAETVAVNRGWTNVKYFPEPDSAKAWLLARDA